MNDLMIHKNHYSSLEGLFMASLRYIVFIFTTLASSGTQAIGLQAMAQDTFTTMPTLTETTEILSYMLSLDSQRLSKNIPFAELKKQDLMSCASKGLPPLSKSKTLKEELLQVALEISMDLATSYLTTAAHELGHASIGILLGGKVEKIVINLNPLKLGGYCVFSRNPRVLPELMYAAGPAAGVLCALTLKHFLKKNAHLSPQIKTALNKSSHVNVLNNLTNLIPVLFKKNGSPVSALDGAHIVKSLATRLDSTITLPVLSRFEFTVISTLMTQGFETISKRYYPTPSSPSILAIGRA
jgi:hypothetical protein